MAIVFYTPVKGISEYITINDDTCKEGIWYLQWTDEEKEKAQKKYLVGLGVNYYIKNSKEEYKMIDKCGGIIPFDGTAFADVRKPQTKDTVYIALTTIVTDDYELEHFDFNVYFEPVTLAGGGGGSSEFVEGSLGGSLADNTCTKYKIAEGATSIGYNTFRGLTTLEEVIVPTSVENISYSATDKAGAFTNCTNLKKISDLTGVKCIYPYVFQGCSSLTEIDVSGADTVYCSAWYQCTNLNTIKIKNGVTIGGFWTGEVGKCFFGTIKGTDDVVHKYYESYTSSSANDINIYVDDETNPRFTLSSSKTSGTIYNVTFTFKQLETPVSCYGFTVTWT